MSYILCRAETKRLHISVCKKKKDCKLRESCNPYRIEMAKQVNFELECTEANQKKGRNDA